VQQHRTWSTGGTVMALKFIAIYPNTPVSDSPTLWADEEDQFALIQSWKPTEQDLQDAKAVGSIPGHSTDVPDHEAIIKWPRVMFKPLRDYLNSLDLDDEDEQE